MKVKSFLQHPIFFLVFLGAVSLLIVTWGLRGIQSQSTVIPLINKTGQAERQSRFEDNQLTSILLGEKSLTVGVVTSLGGITQGLSGREDIGSDGMLFIFSQPQTPGFWMKDMKFDLDLIWMRNNKIVEITENLAAPNPMTSVSVLPKYKPQQTIDMVLEVEAGMVAEWQLQPGDELVFVVENYR